MMIPLFDLADVNTPTPLTAEFAGPREVQEALAAAFASGDVVRLQAALDAEQHVSAGDAAQALTVLRVAQTMRVAEPPSRALMQGEATWEDALVALAIEAGRVCGLDPAEAAEPLSRMSPQAVAAVRELLAAVQAVLPPPVRAAV